MRGEPSAEPRAWTRPFGVLDLMILVVALAPALAFLRERFQFFLRPHQVPWTFHTIALAHQAANTLLISMTFVLVVIMIRRPRADLRLIVRRPGAAACLAALAALTVLAIRSWAKAESMSVGGFGNGAKIHGVFLHLVDYQTRVGFAVLGAWLMLGMVGAWRPEPSWIDRAGRLLGWGWLSILVANLPLPWIEPYLPAI